MFKEGQKLVCIRQGVWMFGATPEMCVINGDIYTYDGVVPYNDNFIFVKERTYISKKTGNRIGFNPTLFRPVDETFGESVAEKLKKEFIQEPELV